MQRLMPMLVLGLLCQPTVTLIAQDADEILEQEQAALTAAVNRAAPSIVQIETIGGLEKVGDMLAVTGPTTGVVVSTEGLVISSAFNFITKPASILVTTPSGKRATANIIARDHSRMLVLLKVNTQEQFVVPQVAKTDQMEVGQWTIAAGRTLSRENINWSIGILSAKNRIWGKAIQSDANISPDNYGGPLIDIHGNIMGILVPLSPQGQGNEIAGAEWYDSGIGFAIPLADIMPRVKHMAEGNDLYPGLLGVSINVKDMYADPVEIGAVQPKSPAYKAGIKTGDRITAINGKPVVRHVQLRHLLGAQYAGDTVEVTIARDEQSIPVNVTLAEKLLPFEHAFLGILPMRDKSDATIRFVYPDSPAATAGLKAGDVITSLNTSLNETLVESSDQLRSIISNLEPGGQVSLTFKRGQATQTVNITLASLPSETPESLPAPRSEVANGNGDATRGRIEIKLPEEQNNCICYVPTTYDPTKAAGLLVWLHAPGEQDLDALLDTWKSRCSQHNLVFLAPQAANEGRWTPGESDFIRKTIDEVIKTYSIDQSRVVVHGHQGGGSMSYLVGFAHRDIVRAIIPIDAVMPARTPVRANDPLERLAVYSITPATSRLKAPISAGLKRLSDAKYPVHDRSIANPNGMIEEDQIQEMLRWLDTLDRI